MTVQKLCSKCKFRHEGCDQTICEPFKVLSIASADTVEIFSKFHNNNLYVQELDDFNEFAQEYYANKYIWTKEEI